MVRGLSALPAKAGRWLLCAAGVLLAWLAMNAALLPLVQQAEPREVTARSAGPLPADEMLERLRQQGLDEHSVEGLTLWHERTRAALVHTSDGRTREFDPYTGELLWPAADVSHTPHAGAARWLSRWWATTAGRCLLTLAALLCALACVARWCQPGRLPRVTRVLLAVATLATGLHLAAATLAWWWPADSATPGTRAATSPNSNELAQAWDAFDNTAPGAYARTTLQLPAPAGAPLRFEYQAAGDAADQPSRLSLRASDDGEAVTLEPWQALPLARQLPALLPTIHGGQWLGPAGVALMLLGSLLLPLLAWWPQRRLADTNAARGAAKPEWLVVYASQSGSAEQLAHRSVAALSAGGLAARLQDLGSLSETRLAQAGRVLFVLATTGQGEEPDHARPFAHRVLSAGTPLPSLQALQYGLLSLGDRRYEDFCGFGRAMEQWLLRHSARPMFPSIEVDRGDADALATWQRRLAALSGGRVHAAEWATPGFDAWRLVQRRCLNPGSAGLATFHVELEPLDAASARWVAGDIAEVLCPQPDGEGGAVREYSIASIEADGAVHLLVRQTRLPDGRLGLGSGWLTERLGEGAELMLRIRSNTGFHAPPDDRPLVLVGNGTGLAGLRAHLRQRARNGRATRNWLLFGERHAAHDFYFRDEIEAWQHAGLLSHVDLAFSRDQAQRVYVQHRLHEQRERLTAWLADGAAVYVCGSSTGMAPAVEAVLLELLGAAGLDELVAAGRYRRDVY